MDAFMSTITEKHANWIRQGLKSIKGTIANTNFGKNYIKTLNSPSFKAKKMVGKGLLVATPVAYGAHQLAQEPETVPMRQA